MEDSFFAGAGIPRPGARPTATPGVPVPWLHFTGARAFPAEVGRPLRVVEAGPGDAAAASGGSGTIGDTANSWPIASPPSGLALVGAPAPPATAAPAAPPAMGPHVDPAGAEPGGPAPDPIAPTTTPVAGGVARTLPPPSAPARRGTGLDHPVAASAPAVAGWPPTTGSARASIETSGVNPAPARAHDRSVAGPFAPARSAGTETITTPASASPATVMGLASATPSPGRAPAEGAGATGSSSRRESVALPALAAVGHEPGDATGGPPAAASRAVGVEPPTPPPPLAVPSLAAMGGPVPRAAAPPPLDLATSPALAARAPSAARRVGKQVRIGTLHVTVKAPTAPAPPPAAAPPPIARSHESHRDPWDAYLPSFH